MSERSRGCGPRQCTDLHPERAAPGIARAALFPWIQRRPARPPPETVGLRVSAGPGAASRGRGRTGTSPARPARRGHAAGSGGAWPFRARGSHPPKHRAGSPGGGCTGAQRGPPRRARGTRYSRAKWATISGVAQPSGLASSAQATSARCALRSRDGNSRPYASIRRSGVMPRAPGRCRHRPERRPERWPGQSHPPPWRRPAWCRSRRRAR